MGSLRRLQRLEVDVLPEFLLGTLSALTGLSSLVLGFRPVPEAEHDAAKPLAPLVAPLLLHAQAKIQHVNAPERQILPVIVAYGGIFLVAVAVWLHRQLRPHRLPLKNAESTGSLVTLACFAPRPAASYLSVHYLPLLASAVLT